MLLPTSSTDYLQKHATFPENGINILMREKSQILSLLEKGGVEGNAIFYYQTTVQNVSILLK